MQSPSRAELREYELMREGTGKMNLKGGWEWEITSQQHTTLSENLQMFP
jgi:hypothetical protein